MKRGEDQCSCSQGCFQHPGLSLCYVICGTIASDLSELTLTESSGFVCLFLNTFLRVPVLGGVMSPSVLAL